MRRHLTIFPVLGAALLSACGPSGSETAPAGPVMKLTSSAFENGKAIPVEFTCVGANRSPPLTWRDPPEGTKSFALVVEDPDAPSGTFRHWGLYNLSADRVSLGGGEGRRQTEGFEQVTNDFGKAQYDGPCPPGGRTHRYDFRLLALDVERLPAAPPNVAAIVDVADGHVLASAHLEGVFGR